MEKKYIFIITIDIFAGTVNVVGGIISNNFYKFLVGILFLILAFEIYVLTKSIQIRDELIDLLEENIKKSDKLLLDAFKELTNPSVIIDLNKIKIPKEFTKPRKEKMKQRIHYYNKNNFFEVPIIIDKNNMLVDGYTSYLIGKKYNMKTVQVKVNIEGQA